MNLFDKISRLADHPLPEGFGEVWVGKFDGARRVEIVSELYGAVIPGLRHCVAYLEGSHDVMGYFYVPNGQSLKEHVVPEQR